MTVPVLTAAAGGSWEAVWVEAAAGDAPVTITRRCVDVVDLLALAAAGHGRAALVASSLRRFDADALDRLTAAGVATVGVVPRGAEDAERRMRALGVEFVVPEDAQPPVVWSVVLEAIRASERRGEVSRGFADPWLSTSSATAGAAAAPGGSESGPAQSVAASGDAGEPGSVPESEAGAGMVIAVWGPTGAPGRTSVALSLADEVARLGVEALLVDADVYGGTVAPAIGFLDESPGLAAACRSAGRARMDTTALAQLCWQARPRLRVLTGIPMAARWPELRTSAIPAVLAAARGLARCTVVDCGFSVETDEEVSYDSLAPRRNGTTLAVLDDADLVLAVGSADPIGMQRLIRALGELRDAEVRTPVRVVLNRVRRGAVPGDPAGELTAALAQFSDESAAALLPYDIDAWDAALANGRFVAEVKPNSAFRKAVRELAIAVAAPVVPDVRLAGRSRRHASVVTRRRWPWDRLGGA